MHFRIRGLPAEHFAPLFSLSEEELAAQGAIRRIADARDPGYPCRVSLTDSQAGDELILLNYEHHPVDSPYRMRFAIYVRRGEETFDAVDTIPDQLRRRILALRAFDADAVMIGHPVIRRSADGLFARSFRLARVLRRAHRSRATFTCSALVISLRRQRGARNRCPANSPV
jgi:hypothetical protein